MPIVYAVVLMVAVAIAVVAFFIAGRAVHSETTDVTDDGDD